MDATPPEVMFFLNGEIYASRSWWPIPRIGDEIMLGPSVKEKKAYLVKRVVWGVEGDRAPFRSQAINIEIEEIE